MEPIVTKLKEQAESWEEPLLQWCEENNSVWNITQKYTPESKEAFVTLLCDKILSLPAEKCTPPLLALRLCLRDPGGLPATVIKNPELTTKVATIAGICGGSARKANPDALRVVINLISKVQASKATLVNECNACEGVSRLISFTDPTDRDSLFLLYRIAVNLSIDNEHVSSALRDDDTIYRSIERDLCPLIPLVGPCDPLLFAPPVATEALKLLFILTMHGGPLAATGVETPLSERETNGLVALFPFFDATISTRNKEQNLQSQFELKIAVVDCLLNLPKEKLGTLVPKEMLMRTVDNLLLCAEESFIDEHKM